MIDIHCHILPGIDDGARTIEESIELIRVEAAGGTRAFIATPHVIDLVDYDRLVRVPPLIEELQEALRAAEIDVEIHPGGEIYPGPNVLQGLKEGHPITLANKGKHMLIDLPMGRLPNGFDDLLYEIQVRGITPIIAHPERNASFQADPDLLKPLVDKGFALQVNAGSIAGQYGSEAADTAWFILEQCWAHFLASDAHRPRPKSHLVTAKESLLPELGEEYLKILFEESGKAVLSGSPLPQLPSPPPREEKKGWFRGLFKRRD